MSSPDAGLSVAALGARTAVGLRAESSAAAANAGISRVQEHPYMRDQAGDAFMVAMDRTIDASSRRERIFILALSAIAEVAHKLPTTREVTLPVFLSLPELGADDDRKHGNALCRRLVAAIVPICTIKIVPIYMGNASGIEALRQARALIEGGEYPFCVVGGVDCHLDPNVLEALDAAGRLSSATNRFGFPPGEGAGMLAVCSHGTLRQFRMRSLARIASIAVTQEPSPMAGHAACIGQGLTAAITEAGSYATSEIGVQYCDIDGERYREWEFSYVIVSVPPTLFANAVDYISPVSLWGHTGAATAPLLAILAICRHTRGFSCDSRVMVWCGSEGGLRGATMIEF